MQYRKSRSFLFNLYPYFGKLTGLNYSAIRIERAKKTWIDKGSPDKLEFIQGDGANLSFEEGTFEKVMCVEVLEWIEEPQKAIEEIYRVLKPNGIAVIIHSDFDTQVFATKD